VTELKPSKSALKREYIALQKLGEELISLKESDLEGIKAHGALRRQKQYIGKLMRHIDPEPLRAAVAKLRR
jgi:ribosome-associated protein